MPDQAVAALLARHPAEHAAVDDPQGPSPGCWPRCGRPGPIRQCPCWLPAAPPSTASTSRTPCRLPGPLAALRDVGADQAVSALAARAAEHASLDGPEGVAGLLAALREAGADQAVSAPGPPAPPSTSTSRTPCRTTRLLDTLREAGADQAVSVLAARAAEHVNIQNPMQVTRLLDTLREAGADQAVSVLAARAAEHADVHNPSGVARRPAALREVGAEEGGTTRLLPAPPTADYGDGALEPSPIKLSTTHWAGDPTACITTVGLA